MTTAIRRWWFKLRWQCTFVELEECRAIWKDRSLDEVAQELCNTRLRPLSTRPFIGSVEQSVGAITQAPLVWALLEEPPASYATQWLLDEFLYGKLTSLKLLQTGETIPLEEEEEQPAHIRLQTLIKLTEQKRSKWIQKPNDILSLATLKLLYDEWKNDWRAWMNQSSQDEWYQKPLSERREFTKSRFRNFLFKICGCYHLVIFWLRVQASPSSLCIFKQVFDEERTGVRKEEGNAKLNRAVALVRDAEV